MKANLLTLFLLAPVAMADFEVHEWGTFTSLSDSRGRILPWYAPDSDISALPKFVKRNPMFAKGALMANIRMETPVIYFYPDEPTTVEVEATFKNGSITELYPAAAPRTTAPAMTVNPNGIITMPTYWKGDLLPPDDAKAKSMIPEVSSDERGAHYAAARNVPDAWIFHHQTQVTDPKTKEIRTEHQADKFIFYRGAGNAYQSMTITNKSEGEVQFQNYGTHAYKNGILLEVKNDKARWSVLPEISKRDEKPVVVTTRINGEWQSVATAEKEMTEWFHQKLAADGLTPEEAKAMVATWHGAWFREPGLRAFTILPRTLVDELLPLKITPKPDSLVRVFVNRHELLSPHREESLADILIDPKLPNHVAETSLNQLELGRFSHAAIQRATEIGSDRMRSRFHELTKPKATSMR